MRFWKTSFISILVDPEQQMSRAAAAEEFWGLCEDFFQFLGLPQHFAQLNCVKNFSYAQHEQTWMSAKCFFSVGESVRQP